MDAETQRQLGEVLVDALTGGPFRSGDIVLHRPTGEEWVVAYHEPESDDLAWCGWPEGFGKGADCMMVKAATDFECRNLIRQLSGTRLDRAWSLHAIPLSQPNKE